VFCALRSADEVSPLRAPALQGCTSAPRTSSGCFSARSVSAASARIGVSQSTVSGGVAAACGLCAVSLRACEKTTLQPPSHTA
jgi:hypothetical protein